MGKARQRASIKQVAWKDIRESVHAVNTEFAALIDELDPSDEYTLYKADYAFGEYSVREGRLQLPDLQGNLRPITDDCFDSKLQEDLGYNLFSHPAALVLNKAVEIFLNIADRTIPLVLVHPGNIVSTWRVLNPTASQHPIFLWNVSSGVRSQFMLSKITAAAGIQRLQQSLKVSIDRPRQTIAHHAVFKQIYDSSNFEEEWFSELLFFGKKWFDHIDDKRWVYFYNHLYKQAWFNTEYHRNEFIWGIIFSLIQKMKNLKPNPYIADTVQHLLAMGIGHVPGFSPTVNNDFGPVSRLQQIFSEVYQLEYDPVIMQPSFFNIQKNDQPVYYSLHYPNTVRFSPRSKTTASKISDLHDIQYILARYREVLNSDALNIDHTPLKDTTADIQYDFFHSEYQRYSGMKDPGKIPLDDPRFLTKGRVEGFAKNSPFLQGCVRVMRKPSFR